MELKHYMCRGVNVLNDIHADKREGLGWAQIKYKHFFIFYTHSRPVSLCSLALCTHRPFLALFGPALFLSSPSPALHLEGAHAVGQAPHIVIFIITLDLRVQ